MPLEKRCNSAVTRNVAVSHGHDNVRSIPRFQWKIVQSMITTRANYIRFIATDYAMHKRKLV